MATLTTNDIGKLAYHEISISRLISRFRSSIIITWLMLLFEGVAYLFIPLVIGMAINGEGNTPALPYK